MSQLIGLMTAYGAVALLAWLAVLLNPGLIPAAAAPRLANRWQWAGLLAIALLATLALGWLRGLGMLLAGEGLPARLANHLVTYAPMLAFIAARRSWAAALVPVPGLLRSLAIGLALALAGLSAWLSVGGGPGQLAALAAGMVEGEAALTALDAVLFNLSLAALLAVLANGWSPRAALILTTLAVIAAHLALTLPDGLDGGELIATLTAAAIALGLFSAFLATRNVVWFVPVQFVVATALALPR